MTHQAIDAVARVGVGAWQVALQPDVVHDLVLPLPRNTGVRQDDLDMGIRS